MNLKSLKLTAAERRAVERWRNGWGHRLWKRELSRLWSGQSSPLDVLWTDDGGSVLRSLQDKLRPHLNALTVAYSGADRD